MAVVPGAGVIAAAYVVVIVVLAVVLYLALRFGIRDGLRGYRQWSERSGRGRTGRADLDAETDEDEEIL